MAERPGISERELADIIAAFNETTERLQGTQRQLQERVGMLSRELERKNEELLRKERLAFLGEMAAGVAHEIRNPLGGVELYASLLERDIAEGDPRRDLVGKILAGIRHMDRIVGDLLAFASNAAPEKRPARLRDVLEESLAETAAAAESAEVRVVQEYADDASVPVDAALMNRVFTNLLRNAFEAAPRGGCVRVRTGRTGDRMAAAIEDNGPGVPADLKSRIFTPFFTTKEKGTGLGLSIVHRIVEGHGGKVRIEDAAGGGARFVVELPLGM
ncbi:MAG: ATP-binding protein [Planctomycetota bacterium]